ncbi:MAG: D-alanine-D-alanine ligase [Planctomycetota bacterium]|jgi:D-alanine-D-alanine ligase
MKKRRILLLMHKALVPPESIEGLSEAEINPWKMEYDVRKTLRDLGHEVRVVGVEDELRPIRNAITEFEPHLCFNLLMYFHDAGVYDSAVVAWLELLKQPYSGCNPRGLLLAGDKALSKKVLAYHRIPVPRFAVFPRGRAVRKLPARLRYPLFVKSRSEHSSTGIAQASIVRDEAHLRERVEFIHRTVGTGAIAEEYIEGRELTIGVLGNQRLVTFPVWEMTFGALPPGAPNIATSRVKWDQAYQEQVDLKTGLAQDLPAGAADSIARMAKRIYRALDLTGYARIDMRMDADGKVWVLEANPNPDLTYGEDLSESAALAGLSYADLVQRIVSLGEAYEPAWKG